MLVLWAREPHLKNGPNQEQVEMLENLKSGVID
jgi:hypothetical protein